MTKVRLFVYGTMMSGQRDHALLAAAELIGNAHTQPRYTLVDIDVYAALVDDGRTAVTGELYLIELMPLATVDRARQVPHLFQRRSVVLSDGSAAESHFMSMEQVRGKRRLGHGNWNQRFLPRSVPHKTLAFAQLAQRPPHKR